MELTDGGEFSFGNRTNTTQTDGTVCAQKSFFTEAIPLAPRPSGGNYDDFIVARPI